MLHALPRHGVRKVSMTDVSIEAGISRGTLYRYFPTKEDLLAALATYIADEYRMAIKRAVEAEPDLERRVGVVIDGIVQFLAARPQLERLIEAEPEFVMGIWRGNFGDLLAPIRDAIAPAFTSPETGRRRTRDLDVVAETILRLALSYQVIPGQADTVPFPRIGEALDRYVQQVATGQPG